MRLEGWPLAHCLHIIDARPMPGCWVYILKCADGSYSVGSSKHADIETRLSQHQQGVSDTAWTRDRRPVELAWAEHFAQLTDAFAAERRLKGWRRQKKEAVIRGDYAVLPALSKRKKSPETGA
jgi:putative endonuclease